MLVACLIAAAAVAAAEPTPAPAPAEAAASIDSILQKLEKPAAADADEQGEEAPPAPPQPQPELRTTPGGTPYADLDARAYADAILASARTAQSMQGPLDGGWSLSSEEGRRIYSFRFSDRGQGMSLAEGAWRDLQQGAGAGVAASGFISSVGYDGEKLMLRFYEAGPEDLVVLTVKPANDGAWRGELWRKGAITKVLFAKQ